MRGPPSLPPCGSPRNGCRDRCTGTDLQIGGIEHPHNNLPRIVEFWNDFDLTEPPFLHPADFASFEENYHVQHAKHTHLDLLPIPYMGHMATADIFVVFLNPGFTEVVDHEKDEGFRRIKVSGISQERSTESYPVEFFDPSLAWHPGYQWMQQTFGALMTVALARRLAILEPFAYHSKEFADNKSQRGLPSVKAMQQFIAQGLAPRAKKSEVTLIIGRGRRLTGLSVSDECDDLIIYDGWECRRSLMTPASRAGKAIIRRMDR